MFDKLKEECGVFGIFGHPEASRMVYLGLYALQHRGQESAGIASADGTRLLSSRAMGYVADAFDEAELGRLAGTLAIGHVRYSTAGESKLANAQPIRIDCVHGPIAICHNGNLVNAAELRESLVKQGSIFQTNSDTEVILHLYARSKAGSIEEALVEALSQVRGAFSLALLTVDKLIAVRDPHGFRPLALGRLGDAWIATSETCALDLIGATWVRDVEPGEVFVVDSRAARSLHPFPPARPAQCIFEHVYFARPDSYIFGESVNEIRTAFGRRLAREAPAEADVIVPVPDSGVPAAIGFARESGIPYELGIIRNHYVGRTFIQPTQSIRDQGVRMKHAANRAVVAGKRIVLVDDSIVRGTTSRKIVQMMRDAGAKEVHFRIASPPITHPDYYGIDTPERDKLLAANHDLEGMRSFIGADSLAFLSVEGIYRAMGYEQRDPLRPQFTDHCFTGDYPTPLTDQTGRETSPRQLSLLAEAG